MSAAALYTKHQRVALGIAKSYHLPGQDRDDVRQEALIGLWDAARRWQPGQAPFPAFAALVIRRRFATLLRLNSKHQALDRAERDYDFPILADELAARETLAAVLRVYREDLTEVEREAIGTLLNGREYGDDKRIDNALQRARRKLRNAA